MKSSLSLLTTILLLSLGGSLCNGQNISVKSPDNRIVINLSFLPAESYKMETWSDSNNSDKEPKELKKTTTTFKSPGSLKVTMSKNGGFITVVF